jgi:glutaminyl-tRNA synthetase
LFSVEFPEEDKAKSFLDFVNPQSLTILEGCKAEPSLAGATPDIRYQFEREGYFCADSVESKPGKLVFNRTIGLRDSFGK